MRHGAASSREGTAASPGWTASKDRAARPSPAPAGHPNRSSCRRTDEGSRTKISRGARGPAGMILARHHHAPLLAGVKVVRPYGALHLDADCGATPHNASRNGKKTITTSRLPGAPATDKHALAPPPS